MIDRLEQNGWWGQIVGPHGSGKSTLLAQLRSSLAQRNRDVIHLELHENQHKLPAGFFASNDWQARTQLVIDGYEQLGRLSRWRIKRHCRSQHCGLLVTTHVDLGLPTIFTTQTQPETAQRLIAQLLKQQGQGSLMGEGLMDEGPYAPDQIAAALQRHQGNLREVLFELYDLYESNRAV
jgi:ABC-type cobalamin/Fe3+-siderophores transport system ATPase subunit